MEDIFHEFDEQMKDVFNTLTMKYSSKGKNYLSTLSTINHVIIAVGVHYIRNEHFYCALQKDIEITTTSLLEIYPTTKDLCQNLNYK